MSEQKIESQQIGSLRVYFPIGETRPSGFWKRLLGCKPLYQELVDAAKTHGLIQAVAAHSTYYGFSGSGSVQAEMSELPNPRMSMFVEIVGPRAALESFCKKNPDMLKSRMIYFVGLERWSIG